MTLLMKCGEMPTAKGYEPFCPVCTALAAVDNNAPDAEEQWDAVVDKAERIRATRAAYGRRRRRR